WSDDLAPRIDRLNGIARDVGFDRGNFAACDRHVAYRVESGGGVDDATSPDDEIVGRRERPWLHRLRCGRDRFVRRLHSYYGRVWLLATVHHRLRLLAFPMRTDGCCRTVDTEIS